MSRWRAAEGPASPARQKAGQPASADPSIRQAGRGRRSVKGRPARERRAAPASAELCPRAQLQIRQPAVSPARRWTSFATTHERPKARAPIAWHLGSSKSLIEPESREQQLKGNEACGYERGTIGVLSQAIEGARLRKWEISRECFNLVCGALQIDPMDGCDDGCNGSFPFQGKSLFWCCT